MTENNAMNETKNILLTILAPTSIFLLAQIGAADQAFSTGMLSAIQSSDTRAILIFAIWSLIFSIGGWHLLVDQKTYALKNFVTKNAFTAYILFLTSIIASIFFMMSLLTN